MAAFDLAAPADAVQRFAEAHALDVGDRVGLRPAVDAREHARAQHGRGKAGAFLVGPIRHHDRRVGLVAGCHQRAQGLERAENAKVAVEFAARRLGVEMAAERNRGQVSPPAGAQGEHVADLIDRHLAAQRLGRVLEPGPHLSVLRGQRLTVNAALAVAPKAAVSISVDHRRSGSMRRLLGIRLSPGVGKWHNLTRAGGSGPRVLASRVAGPASRPRWEGTSQTFPLLKTKRRGFGGVP